MKVKGGVCLMGCLAKALFLLAATSAHASYTAPPFASRCGAEGVS